MAYPGTVDSYLTLVDYEESFGETLNLAASPTAFLTTVSHDILSDVVFSATYGTEVTSTPAAGQFRVLYGTNQIELGPLAGPASINVTYKCAGDIIYAHHINDLQTPIVNIETTLGINPQGAYPDVATRLNSLSASASLIPDLADFAGVSDGVKTSFTLSNPPKYAAGVWVYVNGLRQRFGVHYLVSGSNVVFFSPPKATDNVYVAYFR